MVNLSTGLAKSKTQENKSYNHEPFRPYMFQDEDFHYVDFKHYMWIEKHRQ